MVTRIGVRRRRSPRQRAWSARSQPRRSAIWTARNPTASSPTPAASKNGTSPSSRATMPQSTDTTWPSAITSIAASRVCGTPYPRAMLLKLPSVRMPSVASGWSSNAAATGATVPSPPPTITSRPASAAWRASWPASSPSASTWSSTAEATIAERGRQCLRTQPLRVFGEWRAAARLAAGARIDDEEDRAPRHPATRR